MSGVFGSGGGRDLEAVDAGEDVDAVGAEDGQEPHVNLVE
jgi:hypothetical protein